MSLFNTLNFFTQHPPLKTPPSTLPPSIYPHYQLKPIHDEQRYNHMMGGDDNGGQKLLNGFQLHGVVPINGHF